MTEYSKILNQNFDIHIDKTDYYEEQKERIKRLFAVNLKYWLEREGKKQIDLCNHLGVSSATVSNWSTGTKMPRTDKIQAICNWLGIELSDLLTDKRHEQAEVLEKEASKIAATLRERPKLAPLLDACINCKDEDIELILGVIKRLSDK